MASLNTASVVVSILDRGGVRKTNQALAGSEILLEAQFAQANHPRQGFERMTDS
jgi:hypothetical protein